MDLDAQPIIYRDTMAMWDRIHTERGRFAGFMPLRAPTFQDAVYMLQAVR